VHSLTALVHCLYSVYAIDLLGFGRSSRPAADFSATDVAAVEHFFVDSFERWRAAAGLDKFHLLGHSFGGYVACAYAANNHSRVEKLLLASPFGVPEQISRPQVSLASRQCYLDVFASCLPG